jgi:hypothetical protein
MTARGYRTESLAVHQEDKAAALAALDRHPCVVSARYNGTVLTWSVDLGALPEGDGPAVCEVIRRDVLKAVRR